MAAADALRRMGRHDVAASTGGRQVEIDYVYEETDPKCA
jgi:hypothetical protein